MDDISYIEVAASANYLRGSLDRSFEKAGLPISDLDVLICHHLGDCEETWVQDLLAAGLGADVYKNLRTKYGNTGHTDLPIDLVHFAQEGVVKKDSIVVL